MKGWGRMPELVQVPISPRECWSSMLHIYNRAKNMTHTSPLIQTLAPNHSISTQLALCVCVCKMGTFRHIACTETRSWKLASLHSLSPTASFSLWADLNAGEPLCNSSCLQRSVNTLPEKLCATFSSTPFTLARSDSAGPAATVTTQPSFGCVPRWLHKYSTKAIALFINAAVLG